jgi:hypothetical protein
MRRPRRREQSAALAFDRGGRQTVFGEREKGLAVEVGHARRGLRGAVRIEAVAPPRLDRLSKRIALKFEGVAEGGQQVTLESQQRPARTVRRRELGESRRIAREQLRVRIVPRQEPVYQLVETQPCKEPPAGERQRLLQSLRSHQGLQFAASAAVQGEQSKGLEHRPRRGAARRAHAASEHGSASFFASEQFEQKAGLAVGPSGDDEAEQSQGRLYSA